MMSLQNKLKTLYTPFVEDLGGIVSHYYRVDKTAPWCVWAEYTEPESFHADNRKQEQCIAGYVDYYTKTEWDTNVDVIQDILNAENVAWHIDSVQYEEDTNLIHYRWYWEVI